jgi:hypothetical protein
MLKDFHLEGEEVECGVGVVEERRRFGKFEPKRFYSL